ncbi:MAG: DUF418 domain-containing protein [Bacteroidales bacterium]
MNITEQNTLISTPQKRIEVLDALRGFALLGVIIVHMIQHYGIPLPSNIEVHEARFPTMDNAVRWLVDNVVMGRFINIFAFLFGLSFFIQMDRAERKGIDFRKRFIWRMFILLIIGLFGNAFYTGDILPIYAVFGVLLVFLFRTKTWILMSMFVLLVVGTPRIIQSVHHNFQLTEQIDTEQITTTQALSPNIPEHISNPSFINSAKYNLTEGFLRKLSYQFGMIGRGYLTMALFLLGFVVGRTRFFEKADRLKRKNIVILAIFAFGTFLTELAINILPPQQRIWILGDTPISSEYLLVASLNDLSLVLLSGVLLMLFVTLYNLGALKKYLILVSPYGRMGLTNYEVQSVAGCFIFSMWAFGSFFGRLGLTELFILGLLVYSIQVIISKYFLKRFRYGLLEWFWRSATYLKLQPLKRIQ